MIEGMKVIRLLKICIVTWFVTLGMVPKVAKANVISGMDVDSCRLGS